jgi:wyosine [tRNA(Phe)-imidazoG37] synthetase (radical SAM superfamily)
MHHCCFEISNYQISFAGSVNGTGKIVSLCCNGAPAGVPAVPLGATGEETIQAFRRMREMALLECMFPGEERAVTAGCLKCANYQPDQWEHKYLITYVNLSCYPSPCQCRCVYCTVDKVAPSDVIGEGVAQGYEKVFDALAYALGEGLIDPMAIWQVSCGEITIHPFAERLFDLVKGRTAAFYTNCFRFDPRIAANLAANPRSLINLSIDSGTGGTWRRVKGSDNFGKVIENLTKYREGCQRGNQILLKYIVLPGVNDGPDDCAGVVGLMKALGVDHLTLARDYNTRYSQAAGGLLAAVARFVYALSKNSLSCDLHNFTPSERERVRDLALDILRCG